MVLKSKKLFVSYTPFSNSIFRHADTLFCKNQQYPTPFYLSTLYYHGTPRLLRESILLPDSTKIPMALFLNSRLCRCYTLMTFTPLYPIYPTQFDIRQTGFDKIPLLLCGIRHKMISAERSAAFDRCGGICYNENTKGNTADRRSALRI